MHAVNDSAVLILNITLENDYTKLQIDDTHGNNSKTILLSQTFF
jgi:hypothetical protein